MFYFCFITILYDYVLFTICIFNLSTFYNWLVLYPGLVLTGSTETKWMNEWMNEYEVTEQIKFCAHTSNFLQCPWSPEHVWNPIFCVFWLFMNLFPFISMGNWNCVVFQKCLCIIIICMYSHIFIVSSLSGFDPKRYTVVCCVALNVSAWMLSWDVGCGDRESEETAMNWKWKVLW
jgi:hypothetical protein